MSTVDTTTQVMMTLAALAATGATERPSGESLRAQEQRVLTGINQQLANTNLATAGEWSAIWVGLTASRANLAYIAINNNTGGSPAYALCLRGTMAGSPIDTSEDMEVGLLLPFAVGGGPGNISQGAMEAFTDIIMGTELMETLKVFAPYELYVTGHSLGGALVTTVSLYLAQNFLPAKDIYPFTFAAPTAGDAAFATWFDKQLPSAMCYYNYYDLVPNAWVTLTNIPANHKTNPFYPNSSSTPAGPGPTATPVNSIGIIIDSIAKNTNGNGYAQPAQQPALNSPADGTPIFSESYPQGAETEVEQFEVQVGYQHANNTYLTLLGATPLPAVAPVVESVNPSSGPPGTAVTISPPIGNSFSPGSVVDFGIVPAAAATVAPDGSSITAIAPFGVGIVDIRVTNIYGTSPVAPVYPNLTPYAYNDQFTFRAAGGT
jgi:hypothetical protein